MAVSAFYGACEWCSPPAPPPTRRSQRSGSAPSACCAGIAAWTPRASTRPCATRSRQREHQRALRRADHQREGRRAARRRLPRGARARAAPAPGARRRRARAGAPARAPRRGSATFLGWLEGEELARAYASADIFLFPSATDTFGQVILEAQASGLPVVAVAEGGPLSLDRAPCQRPAVPADAGGAGRRRCSSWRARRCCASVSRAAGSRRRGSAPGSARSSAWRRLSPRSRQGGSTTYAADELLELAA